MTPPPLNKNFGCAQLTKNYINWNAPPPENFLNSHFFTECLPGCAGGWEMETQAQEEGFCRGQQQWAPGSFKGRKANAL